MAAAFRGAACAGFRWVGLAPDRSRAASVRRVPSTGRPPCIHDRAGLSAPNVVGVAYEVAAQDFFYPRRRVAALRKQLIKFTKLLRAA